MRTRRPFLQMNRHCRRSMCVRMSSGPMRFCRGKRVCRGSSVRCMARTSIRCFPCCLREQRSAGPHASNSIEMIGHVIGQSYTAQLRNWCRAHGGRFSGHYLGEEMLVDHVRSYGNMLSVQRQSDYPGMDILGLLAGGLFPAGRKICPDGRAQMRLQWIHGRGLPVRQPGGIRQGTV